MVDWAERQEYYDLIEEEIRFIPEKGRKWILTLEERHSYEHDIVFHVYSDQGKYMLLVFEIVDVMELEVKKRLHNFGDTLSGNFRIRMSTLVSDLPVDFEHDPDSKAGSSFKLSFAKKEKVQIYEWEFAIGNFKRIEPVLKLIWAVDQWRHGAKVMGWSAKGSKGRKVLGEGGKESKGSSLDEKNEKKGRIDPFGSIWKS